LSVTRISILSMQDNRPGTDAGRPHGCRTLARATQWCLRRTERDARLAKKAGRPITSRNLRRLLLRRLWAVVEAVK